MKKANTGEMKKKIAKEEEVKEEEEEEEDDDDTMWQPELYSLRSSSCNEVEYCVLAFDYKTHQRGSSYVCGSYF